MPRVLPWQRSGTETSVKKEATPRKRVKTESVLGRDLTPRNPPSSPSKRDFFRSCAHILDLTLKYTPADSHTAQLSPRHPLPSNNVPPKSATGPDQFNTIDN